MAGPPLPRRALLAALPGLFLARRAQAFGDGSRFVPAVAQHAGRWNVRLSGLRRIAWELQRRTSVEVVAEARPLALNARLFDYPFIYFGGEGDFPPLAPSELETLRRYLSYGGFLLADANDGSSGAGFDAAFRREMCSAW